MPRVGGAEQLDAREHASEGGALPAGAGRLGQIHLRDPHEIVHATSQRKRADAADKGARKTADSRTADAKTADAKTADAKTAEAKVAKSEKARKEAEAKAAIGRAQADWADPVVTTIEAAAPWYGAEDEHQEYFDRIGDKNPYCAAVVSPKVRKFMVKYANRLKG